MILLNQASRTQQKSQFQNYVHNRVYLNKMDFAIFDKKEVEEMFRLTYERMPEKMRKIAVDEFGGVDEWKKHFMEVVSSEDMQKKYAKLRR